MAYLLAVLTVMQSYARHAHWPLRRPVQPLEKLTYLGNPLMCYEPLGSVRSPRCRRSNRHNHGGRGLWPDLKPRFSVMRSCVIGGYVSCFLLDIHHR